MFSRTTVYTLIVGASLMLTGIQAIGSDEQQPEASVIGLGQEAAAPAAHTAAPSLGGQADPVSVRR